MSENFKVAIIGSGPSGFFAAEELLSKSAVDVDMFERLPTPFGLVRGGVAPDHQKIKSVVAIFNKTAQRSNFRFLGNVELGRDVMLDQLRQHYHAIILATGAKSDQHLNIPGENLSGSVAATNFVGWYNAHPDYQDEVFDLSCASAVIVGNGNVAMDVARVLVSDPDDLASTDIAEHALQLLRQSQLKDIYILGRRGILQAAFTNPEIRELCHLNNVQIVVDAQELASDVLSQKLLQSADLPLSAKNNYEILKEQVGLAAIKNGRRLHFRFLVSPIEILGTDGKVSAVRICKNELVETENGGVNSKKTDALETIPAGLVLRSVGYKGTPLAGLPYEDRKGTLPNQKGRVIDPQTKNVLPGTYVVGWAKRGPSGVIGTNKPDSIESAQCLLQDLQEGKLPSAPKAQSDLAQILNIKVVTFADWKKLDAQEIAIGQSRNKIREKFTRVADMLRALS